MLQLNEDIFLLHQGGIFLYLPHSRLFSPPKAVISSQTWFSLLTQRQKQVLIWTFATNKCLPIGPHVIWKFWEMLSPLKRAWDRDGGGGVGMAGGKLQGGLSWSSAALAALPLSPGWDLDKWQLKKKWWSWWEVAGDRYLYPNLEEVNITPSAPELKIWLGKSVTWGEKTIPGEKKIPLARQCDLTPWEIFLGSNLCPLQRGVPPQAESAWMCVSMLMSLLSEVQ